MLVRRCRFVLALVLLAPGAVSKAQDVADTATAAADSPEPQIVRVRYVEGDVRVARGEAGESEWEQAVADLALETGFHLVTGTGRAEIEFEDGSTVYLGENSVLAFDDLHTTGDVPHTEINLLAGTLTLHILTESPGDVFILKTPTDRITTAFPERRYVRVTSYLDAIAMTPQVVAGHSTTAAGTVFHNDGKPVDAPEGAADSTAFAEWDRWVVERVALRSAQIAAAATASGLPASTPGLADMNGEGVFFDCAPYGKCWEPSADSADPQNAPAAGPDFDIVLAPAAVTIHPGGRARTKLSAVGFLGFTYPIEITTAVPVGFSCIGVCAGQISPGETLAMQFASAPAIPVGTYTVIFTATSGPLTHTFPFTIYVGEDDALPYEPVAAAEPYFPCFPGGGFPHGTRVGYHRHYGWAVCHTGTWIYRQHIYVWVAPKRGEEHKHHHHPPIWWVDCGKKVCCVPKHPDDKPGKVPLNCKHEMYHPHDKKGEKYEVVTTDFPEQIGLLEGPPKEFRTMRAVRLERAAEPVIRAREMRESDAKGSATLRFDRSSRHFVVAREVVEGKHRRTVTETIAEHRETARAGQVEVHGAGGRTPGSASGHGSGSVTRVGSSAAHTGGAPSRSSATAHPSGGGSHAGGASHAGSGSTHSSPSHSSGGGSHSGSSGSHSTSSKKTP